MTLIVFALESAQPWSVLQLLKLEKEVDKHYLNNLMNECRREKMTQRQMLQESRSALKSLLRFCLTLSDDELRVGQMVHGRREEKKATAGREPEDAGVQRAVGPGVRRKLLAAARAGHRTRWLVRDRDGQPSRRSRPSRPTRPT